MKSKLLSLGFILLTAGNFLSALLNFGWGSIFGIGFLVLPVAGIWIIFAAFKTPAKFSLLKILAIVKLILMYLAEISMLFVASVIFASAEVSGTEVAPVGRLAFGWPAMFASTVIVITILVGCFIGIMKVLDGIKYTITYNIPKQNMPKPLSGIKTFTIFNGISACLAVLGMIVSFVFWQTKGEDSIIILLSILFGVVGLAGAVICLTVLNKPNYR
jgi:hypothetical protein